MNTTAAALEAHVTTATIRMWARNGVIAAVKAAGRWVIDTASLARRIAIGNRRKPVIIDRTQDFLNDLTDEMYGAADHGSIAGLKALLVRVQARDSQWIAGVDPAHVHLTDAQWSQAERSVSFQIGCLRAEH